MAKLIFGCALMLGGIIGGTGWLIAVACLTEAGAWSSLFNLFPVLGFGLLDGYVVLLFYAIAVVGAVIAVRALKVSASRNSVLVKPGLQVRE